MKKWNQPAWTEMYWLFTAVERICGTHFACDLEGVAASDRITYFLSKKIFNKVNHWVTLNGRRAAVSCCNIHIWPRWKCARAEGQHAGSRWLYSKSWKWFLRQYSVTGLVFPLLAILRVDHSVVDLETIEALYENVRIKRDDAAAKALKATQPRLTMTLCPISFGQRVQPDELERIKKHYETSAEEDVKLLDKPEQSVSDFYIQGRKIATRHKI